MNNKNPPSSLFDRLQSACLPEYPNLDSLKKQAKQLLKYFRDANSDAIRLVETHHPDSNLKNLRDAQWLVARCYGYEGWRDLSEAIELALLNKKDLAALALEYIDLACVRYDGTDTSRYYLRANRLLEQNTGLAQFNLITAIISHQFSRVEALLLETPDLVHQTFPPRDWQPLLYLCYSRISDPSNSGIPVKIAELLLNNGANPNVFFSPGNDCRFTALTGVIGEGEAGIINQPPHQYAKTLADLLLRVGANPNDSQALYNTMFTDSADYWLAKMVSAGLNMKHKVNWDDRADSVTMFNFLLETSIRLNKLNRANYLLSLGANPNAKCHYTNRSIYTQSLVKGKREFSSLFANAGAKKQDLTYEDRFLIAIQERDECTLINLLQEQAELLFDPTLLEDATPEILKLLIDHGYNLNKQDQQGKTALHVFARNGNLECVKQLLDHGADPEIRDFLYQGKPVAHAHFNGNYEVRNYLLNRYDYVIESAACGQFDTLKRILERDPAQANSRGFNGNMPLHVVCHWLAPHEGDEERERIVDLLMQYGADIFVKNADGRTPIDLNRALKDDENVKALSKYYNR